MNKEVMELLTNRAIAERKIGGSNVPAEIRVVVSTLLSYFDYFNELSEDAFEVHFNDVIIKVEEVLIPKEFAFIILPKSIRVNPLDRKTKDMRIVPHFGPELEEGSVFNYNEYIDNVNRFRSFFKKDFTSNFETLSNLRKSVSLFDTFSRLAVPDIINDRNTFSVHYFEDNIWPYFVDYSVLSLFRANYFNSEFSYVANDFISRITF